MATLIASYTAWYATHKMIWYTWWWAWTMSGNSFLWNGYVLDSVMFRIFKDSNTADWYPVVARIYAHTWTFGSTGTATGSVLAESEAILTQNIWTSSAEYTFTFTWVNKITLTNWTYYCVVLYYTWNWWFYERINCWISNTATTYWNNVYNNPSNTRLYIGSYSQYFEIYWDQSSSIKTVNWLAKASVKTVNWLAIASVKTFNWLA